MSKRALLFGATVGSVVGGYLPVIFGGSGFSLLSLLLSGVGGIVGILAAHRLTR